MCLRIKIVVIIERPITNISGMDSPIKRMALIILRIFSVTIIVIRVDPRAKVNAIKKETKRRIIEYLHSGQIPGNRKYVVWKFSYVIAFGSTKLEAIDPTPER